MINPEKLPPVLARPASGMDNCHLTTPSATERSVLKPLKRMGLVKDLTNWGYITLD